MKNFDELIKSMQEGKKVWLSWNETKTDGENEWNNEEWLYNKEDELFECYYDGEEFATVWVTLKGMKCCFSYNSADEVKIEK